MFAIGFAVGSFLGGLIVGVIAHRKPEWFNKAVVIVNKIDDDINAKLKG